MSPLLTPHVRTLGAPFFCRYTYLCLATDRICGIACKITGFCIRNGCGELGSALSESIF